MQLVDIRGFYGQWWAVLDFALLLTVFTGIAHATVGRRLEGPGGQLATIGIGGVLALAGLGFEWTMGITLASLAPVAAGIFFVLLAVAAYALLRSIGLGVKGAGVGSLVLMALAISAIGPTFAGWMTGVVQLAAFGGLLVVMASVLFGRGAPPGGSALAADASALADHQSDEEWARRGWSDAQGLALRDEKATIARALRPVTKEARKSTDRILKELYLVRKVLARGPPSPKERQEIAASLSKVTPQRSELAQALEKVRRLDEQLRAADERSAAALAGGGSPVTAKQRSAAYRIALEEREKIDVEKKIAYVQGFVEKYDAEAGACLKSAADELVRGDVATARRWLDAAIAREEEAAKMIRRTQALEKMLLRLTKGQMRQLRHAA